MFYFTGKLRLLVNETAWVVNTLLTSKNTNVLYCHRRGSEAILPNGFPGKSLRQCKGALDDLLLWGMPHE